jgi:uncharacterized membrane protein (UPF0127 family)
MMARKITATTLLSLILLAFSWLPVLSGGDELSEFGNRLIWVALGQVRVRAEVVTTPEKLFLGLGYREGLPEGRGMLFVMPGADIQVFCMRGMKFPIDIIWVAQGKIAGLEKNISPQYSGDLTSPVPVNYVLEVPGGFCDRHGLKLGDKARW